MAFGQLCAPALIYIVFSITQVTMDSLKGMHNVAFVKLFISILFTILLNHLCQRGLGIVAWIIVFIPFMLMSVIVGLLLLVLGLDPKTGKLNMPNNEPKQREYDVREKAIMNYSMTRTKKDYAKRLNELGYMKKVDGERPFFFSNLQGKGMTFNPGLAEREKWKGAYNNTSRAIQEDGYNNETKLTHVGQPTTFIRVMILAEEFYKMIKEYKKDGYFTWKPTEQENIVFNDNCHVGIKLYFEDFYYTLKDEMKILDGQPIEKQNEYIEKFLSESLDKKAIPKLRDLYGKELMQKNKPSYKLSIFEEHRRKMFEEGFAVNRLMLKFKARTNNEKLYDSNCDKINEILKKVEDIDLDEKAYSKRNSEYTKAFSKALNEMGDFDYIVPTQCSDAPGLKEKCELLNKGSECAVCNEDDYYMSGDKSKFYIGCPYGCKKDTEDSDPVYGMLCKHCNLCTDSVEDKAPPQGKSWVDITQLKRVESCGEDKLWQAMKDPKITKSANEHLLKIPKDKRMDEIKYSFTQLFNKKGNCEGANLPECYNNFPDVCTTEEECKKVAEAKKLKLGKDGKQFASIDYQTKGLFKEKNEDVAYFGIPSILTLGLTPLKKEAESPYVRVPEHNGIREGPAAPPVVEEPVGGE